MEILIHSPILNTIYFYFKYNKLLYTLTLVSKSLKKLIYSETKIKYDYDSSRELISRLSFNLPLNNHTLIDKIIYLASIADLKDNQCQRCFRKTSNLTQILENEIVLNICQYGCLTVCTHCSNNKIIFLPPIPKYFQKCSCNHQLIRTTKIVELFDVDLGCQECLSNLIYGRQNLNNDHQSIVLKKELINHLHEFL